MLTPPEVAKRLKVNPNKVRYWIISGELKAVNLVLNRNLRRPQYRIAEADLEAFLLRRTAIPAPSKARPAPARPKPTHDFASELVRRAEAQERRHAARLAARKKP